VSDKRARQRRRTRLRSGKIAGLGGRFIVECAVHDRSSEGARLRLADRAVVPDRILLLEDEGDALNVAAVVWRRGQEIGVRFAPDIQPADPEAARHRLTGKYYAV
jgi:hypothetical protein